MLSLVAELRLSVVGGVEVAEERVADSVELHDVAFHVAADDVIADAASLEVGKSFLQGVGILAEHHVGLRLGSSIAALQPTGRPTLVAGLWRRDVMLAHQLLQHAALAVHDAAGTVDHAPPLLLKAFKHLQRLGQTGHREVEVGLVGGGELSFVDPSQCTRHALLLELPANVVAGGFENQPVFLNGVGREAVVATYGYEFHLRKNSSALRMSLAWSMSRTFVNG